MELTNDFVIDRDIDQTWKILNDLEFIAPCMPGAKLTEVEGDEYRGFVKIKVGPITANYKGKASFVEQDEANKVAKLKAEGRDPRQGNANAMVTAKMESVSADQTKVTIHTDLGLSGKLASFGRGAIEDVSKKILGQFVENLRQKLSDDGSDPSTDAGSEVSSVASAGAGSNDKDDSAATASTSSSATSSGSATSSDTGSASGGSSGSSVRKINSADPEPVDLLSVGGTSTIKRVLPAVGVTALVIVVLRWLIKRR